MNVSPKAAARGGKFWARLCALPAFSFLLNGAGGVARVKDPSGNWVELSEVQQIVDDAESCIAQLDVLASKNLVDGHGAPAQDGAAAFKSYLQECDDCAIVPDVAGAFVAGMTAASRSTAQEHATPVASGAVARIREVDEFGPCLDWFKHWVGFPAGTLLYIQTSSTEQGKAKP